QAAACGNRVDVHQLEVARPSRNATQVEGALRGIHGSLHIGLQLFRLLWVVLRRVCRSTVHKLQLKPWPVVACGNHGDTPPRHRGRWIERRRLQETTFGLAYPEGVHLRDALVKELLSPGVCRGDREMDAPLAFEKLCGQRWRCVARIWRALILRNGVGRF